jgi:hypothetical protein
VIGISLPANNLVGTIPPALSGIDHEDTRAEKGGGISLRSQPVGVRDVRAGVTLWG